MRHSSTTSRCQDGLHEGDPLRFCKSRMRGNGRAIRNVRSSIYFGGSGFEFRLEFLLELLATSEFGFPLSGPESGHTERRSRAQVRLSRPFSFIRTLTVGFGIAPNLLTLLPQGFQGTEFQEKKALAGLGCFTLTAGGDFHPALRTSAARNERPEGTMANGRPRQQAPSPWGNRMSPCASASLEADRTPGN